MANKGSTYYGHQRELAYVHNSMVDLSRASRKCQFYAIFSLKILMVSDKTIQAQVFQNSCYSIDKTIYQTIHWLLEVFAILFKSRVTAVDHSFARTPPQAPGNLPVSSAGATAVLTPLNPGVYTRVTRYNDWISGIVNNN